MSSVASFVAQLSAILKNIYIYGGPLLIGIGTLSCILSVIIFTKKHLRNNPCSIYLIAYNICSFLYINISLLTSTLIGGFNIDLTIKNQTFCRFSLYTLFVLSVLGPCYLILASVDRVLITSRNARTRQRSTAKLAYILIVIMSLFWSLFHIHLLILSGIFSIIPGKNTCYFQPGTHAVLVTYYLLIVKNILIPALMIIVALWAVKNVRGVGQVQPISMTATSGPAATKGAQANRSKDRQLLRMLLFDILIYVFFNILTPVVMIVQQQPQTSANVIESILLSFLASVGVFASFVPQCIGFYVKLVISKTFREEVKKLFLRQ